MIVIVFPWLWMQDNTLHIKNGKGNRLKINTRNNGLKNQGQIEKREE